MSIEVRFEGKLPEQFRATSARFDLERHRAMERIGQRGVTIARAIAPRYKGSYAAKMQYTVDTGARSVTIGSTSQKAHLVEKGRGPGKPPPAWKLQGSYKDARAALKSAGIKERAAKTRSTLERTAFLVARAIGRRGTKGHHVIARTRTALRPFVDREAAVVLRKMGDRT